MTELNFKIDYIAAKESLGGIYELFDDCQMNVCVCVCVCVCGGGGGGGGGGGYTKRCFDLYVEFLISMG